jgi:hypothetical protein
VNRGELVVVGNEMGIEERGEEERDRPTNTSVWGPRGKLSGGLPLRDGIFEESCANHSYKFMVYKIVKREV